MKPTGYWKPLLAGLLLLLASISCSFGTDTVQPGQTPVPTRVESEAPPTAAPPLDSTETLSTVSPEQPAPEASPTTEVQATQPPTSLPDTPLPPAQTACGEEVCSSSGSFLLKRPVAPPGRNTIVYSDRYGSYVRGRRDANHGVSFLNSTGTPVLAAADGVVVVAGNDAETDYGVRKNYYGNLVILRHTLPGIAQDVYTLYAHLAEIFVQVDQAVTAGQEIGLSGSSGAVRGSILYFEVRLGENSYSAARNPELWLEPMTDEAGQPLGAIAGQVLDAEGNPVKVGNILLERLGEAGQPAVDQIYLKTYADQRLGGLNPWGESFAAGDLPPGSYQISFWRRGLHQRVVEVTPGQLITVNFRVQ